MKLVVDANVIFSTLIKEGKTAELLLNFAFKLYTPYFVLEEIADHKDEILEKTKRSEEDFEEILNILSHIIETTPRNKFGDFIEQAKEICPDKNDVDYFALALKLKCAIWSNDKRLKEQDIVKIYSTEELIQEFDL